MRHIIQGCLIATALFIIYPQKAQASICYCTCYLVGNPSRACHAEVVNCVPRVGRSMCEGAQPCDYNCNRAFKGKMSLKQIEKIH